MNDRLQSSRHFNNPTIFSRGEGVCKEKLHKVLDEFSVPSFILPQEGTVEFGFNRSTGYFWLKQKEKKEHKFKKIGKTIIFDEEITAFIEKHHLSKITGIKGKAPLLSSISISEMLVGTPSSDKVKFITKAGISFADTIASFEPSSSEEFNPK